MSLSPLSLCLSVSLCLSRLSHICSYSFLSFHHASLSLFACLDYLVYVPIRFSLFIMPLSLSLSLSFLSLFACLHYLIYVPFFSTVQLSTSNSLRNNSQFTGVPNYITIKLCVEKPLKKHLHTKRTYECTTKAIPSYLGIK